MRDDVVFADVFRPTEDEIRAWAYAPNSGEPVQDWDLVLATIGTAPLLLRLAADRDCPHRTYFLGCLHVIAEDAVRTGYRTTPSHSLEALLRDAAGIDDPGITTWAGRTRELMATRQPF
jgi:hypothetical protein